jgi:anaerobilin synthase
MGFASDLPLQLINSLTGTTVPVCCRRLSAVNVSSVSSRTPRHTLSDQDWLKQFHAAETDDPLRYAFPAKRAIHPGSRSRPTAPGEAAELYGRLVGLPRRGPSAAYFHIPFCETRCSYCGFFNRFAAPEESSRYTSALIRELESEALTPAVLTWPIHAVYLGGGTPTALEPADLERLLLSIKRILPLANDCEITLEGRVSGLSDDCVAAALAGGVNRFSIGVQSFDTEVRRSIGRIDDGSRVVAALERLCSHDQASVVVDLVFGFPGQTMEIWERDLLSLKYLPLDGVDLYQLNLLPNTTLARMIRQGESRPAATLPEQAAMFERGEVVMEQLLWSRLSISHWRRNNRERSLYNRLVKSGASILAYGCGAGGSLHAYRYATIRDYAGYLEAVASGDKPLAMVALPPDNRILALLLGDGFDRGCLDLEQAECCSGLPVREWCGPLLEQWRQIGLLALVDGRVHLTRAGRFWQATLAQSLIEVCDHFGAAGPGG